MSSGDGDDDNDFMRKCRNLLRAFAASSSHIQACAVISNDGFIIASVLTEGEVDEDRFGAMCASLLSLATRAASEIQRGDLRQIILDGSLGPMLLTRAGRVGVLAVATSPQANLGKVILDTRNTARSLGELG
jgi:predicted regulator of Ras-like GTPase activity (Roadblock/LC7/MglB family)